VGTDDEVALKNFNPKSLSFSPKLVVIIQSAAGFMWTVIISLVLPLFLRDLFPDVTS